MNPAGRNLRSVWEIPTQAFPEAHFATYPTKLVEPCIKAGTSEKGECSRHGIAVERIVEMTPEYKAVLDSGKAWRDDKGKPDGLTNRHNADHPSSVPQKNTTVGWRCPCRCSSPLIPQIVLDPFSGAGTTGLVANRLGRSYIGIEINPEYARMGKRRIEEDAPLFNRELV